MTNRNGLLGEDAMHRKPNPKPYLRPLRGPKALVLVLEEDPFLRPGLCSVLTAAGYGLAGNADATHPLDRIDLILAGAGARSKLQRLDRAAPVILLVDHATWLRLDFLDAANDLGAVAVLQRPFSHAALLGLVAQVLAQPERAGAPAGRRNRTEPLVLLDNPNLA